MIDMCSLGGVDKLAMHTAYGDAPAVCELGLSRFSELERHAEAAGVHICYENGDVAEHLIATVTNARPYHGFCYDSGHAFCHTPDTDYLALLGERLLYTHLHDNDGQDDLHLLPLDGAIDWQKTIKSIKGANYAGTYNLELSCRNRAAYGEMSYEDFTKEAAARAKKLLTI